MNDWTAVAFEIGESIGRPLKLWETRAVTGGCINETAVLESDQGPYFVKRNAPDRLPMFIAEAEGLRLLASTGAIRVPAPICWGHAARASFLALEYLDLQASSSTSDEKLGRQLATLHQVTRPMFGWQHDNTIGSTPQLNGWVDSWIDFWRSRRLGFQLGIVKRNGYQRLAAKGERLLNRLESLFVDHICAPSLCHGDLWSGNVGTTRAGDPVLFDPAVYFGDRETDIAMAELFGGFADCFYAAYQEVWPLPAGYEARRSLYNLYHVLNHVNLFGGSYARQAEQLMDRLLGESV